MTTPGDTRGDACPPDSTLEEYALGLLSPGAGDQVVRHIATCEACATRAECYRRELPRIRAALLSLENAPDDDCPKQETLALYIDRALDEQQYDRIEAHLSRCRPCQKALKDLFRELLAVRNPDAPLETVEGESLETPEPVRLEDERERCSQADATPPRQEPETSSRPAEDEQPTQAAPLHRARGKRGRRSRGI